MSQGPNKDPSNSEGPAVRSSPEPGNKPNPAVARADLLRGMLLSCEPHDRITAMGSIAENGVDRPALLDAVTSRMRATTATTNELREAARALLSPHHAPELLGLRIEGIAQYLLSVTSASPLDTVREAITFLNRRAPEELLLSPTVFALAGLNPHLRDGSGELGRVAAPLLAHLRAVNETCARQVLLERGHTWQERATKTIEMLRGFYRPELETRAALLEQVELLRAVKPESVAALAARHAIALLCQERGESLLSQSLGDRVAGSLRHSVGTGVNWLTCRVGAASAEQLIRIAFQPIPVRELRLGFHHDTGTFRAGPLPGSGLDDELRRASLMVAMREFLLPEGEERAVDLSQHEELLEEFASRSEEVISRAPFGAVCAELEGLTQSPIVSHIETLGVPDFLLSRLSSRHFPGLKHLELFRATERINLDSYDAGILVQLESLILTNGARLSMVRKAARLTNLRRIEVCNADECFNLTDLSRRYGLEQLQSIALRAAPSCSALKHLMAIPGLSTARFVWSKELDFARVSGESSVSHLEISGISSQGIRKLTGVTFPSLRHLALRKIDEGAESVLPILDTLRKGQLDVFEITTQDASIAELETVLNHPALCNVRYLTLGIPGTIDVMRRLSQMQCPMPKLHSLGFENDAIRSTENGYIDSVEQGVVTKWLTQTLSEVRYPWPLSDSSLLTAACNQPHAEVRFGSTTYAVVRDEVHRDSSSVRFILKRRNSE
jgi:hypothetical protein